MSPLVDPIGISNGALGAAPNPDAVHDHGAAHHGRAARDHRTSRSGATCSDYAFGADDCICLRRVDDRSPAECHDGEEHKKQ
jgi:hypothetical protein